MSPTLLLTMSCFTGHLTPLCLSLSVKQGQTHRALVKKDARCFEHMAWSRHSPHNFSLLICPPSNDYMRISDLLQHTVRKGKIIFLEFQPLGGWVTILRLEWVTLAISQKQQKPKPKKHTPN